MQLLQRLLFSLAVVNLVSSHVYSRAPSGRQDDDDPMAMVASMDGHHSHKEAANTNVVYSTRDHEDGASDWQVNLDQRQAINLGWTLDHGLNEVLFTLKINTTRTRFHRGSDIFALGFSDYGQLVGADFCLLWFDLAHSVQMQDAISDSAGRLSVLDKTDSYCKLLVANPPSGGNLEDLLVFKFSRPLDTCQQDYYVIDNGTTHLVWFKMDGPLVDMNKINLGKLSDKQSKESPAPCESGLTRVQLAAIKLAQPLHHNHRHRRRHHRDHYSSARSLDVRMEDYPIPARETTYWCKLFKLPHQFEQRKFHITKYEAIIGEGNEHIVHHMELFNCVYENSKQSRDLDELYENLGGWSGECSATNRPGPSKICRRVIMAWAMGAKPLEYPQQVGQSIGGAHYSPYVVLEVHYNNLESTKGLVDNSGLRFHYTHKLRPFDAGIMEVGLEYTDKNSIPPNVIAPLAGYCVSECTRAAMSGAGSASGSGSGSGSGSAEHDQGSRTTRDNYEDDEDLRENAFEDSVRENTPAGGQGNQKQPTSGGQPEGVYIFAAQMHTHLAGVASWTEQIREGRLVRELQRDNHYSPHFQEIRLLPEPVHLMPGDALIHYCLYDTRHRSNITLGGFATSDEMCVTYLHYYPRLDLEVCKSSVDSRALDEYFARLVREENQPISGNNLSPSAATGGSVEEKLKAKSVSEKYQSIEWSRRRSNELLELYASSPLSVQCNRSNGDRFPGYWNGVTPTKVYWTNDEDSRSFELAGDQQATSSGPRLAAAGQQQRQSHLDPQIIMQYRGGRQLRQTTAATQSSARAGSKCAPASLHKRQPGSL